MSKTNGTAVLIMFFDQNDICNGFCYRQLMKCSHGLVRQLVIVLGFSCSTFASKKIRTGDFLESGLNVHGSLEIRFYFPLFKFQHIQQKYSLFSTVFFMIASLHFLLNCVLFSNSWFCCCCCCCFQINQQAKALL